MKRFSIVEAFLFSVETIKKHPLLILIPTLISRMLNTGLIFLIRESRVVSASIKFPQLTLITFSVLLLFVVTVFITSISSIGLFRTACLAFDNQDESIKWSAYWNFGNKALFIFITYHSIVLGSSFFYGWFARNLVYNPNFLYILPSFYLVGFFIWLQFLFTPYLIAEKNMSLQDALRASFRLTKWINGRLLAFFSSYLLIALVIDLPFMFLFKLPEDFNLILTTILSSIMFAFLSIAIIYIYKDISYQDENPENPNSSSELKGEDCNPDDELRIPIETLMK